MALPAGALVSNKKSRKAAATALKVGGLAALGGLAWKAYQGYQAGHDTTPAQAHDRAGTSSDGTVWGGLDERVFAVDPADNTRGSRALLLIQAMISAACADGHLDNDERGRIMARVEEARLAPDEKALVFDSLQQPLSLTDLSQRVDTPELAAEVYLASLLAVDSSRIQAELYLDALAFRLGLPQALVAQMHQQLPQPSRAVA